MLVIRDDQMRAFETVQPETFKPRMVQHLANHFPEKSDMLGKEGLLELIDDGLMAAKDYGLETMYEVCCYIDIALMLGRGFNTDPLLEGIIRLSKCDAANATATIRNLLQATHAFEQKIRKPGERFPLKTYQLLTDAPYEDIDSQLWPPPKGELWKFFGQIWPEKHRLVNSTRFEAFFRKAHQKAIGYGLPEKEGAGYYCLLMFLFGHDLDSDRQYFWLISILQNEAYVDKDYKLFCLHFTAQKYVEALLEKPLS